MSEQKTGRTQTYTLQQCADALQLSWRTVWQYVHDGKLKAVKLGRTWRVTQASLDALLEKGTGDDAGK